MWFEHNDMEDLERLLKEQQDKDRKVTCKIKYRIFFWAFFTTALVASKVYRSLSCANCKYMSVID